MRKKEAPSEYAKSLTAVWWDINSCPIPNGFDPYLVGPMIDTALMKSGYSGPLTITAVGDLDNIPAHVLLALSSTGIVIKDVACGIMSINLVFQDWVYKSDNPPRCTLMLITNYLGLQCFDCTVDHLQKTGRDMYNILFSSTQTLPKPSRMHIYDEWRWDNLLIDADANKQDITRHVRSKEAVESAMFSCHSCLCPFSCQSVDEFLAHVEGSEHAQTCYKGVAKCYKGKSKRFRKRPALRPLTNTSKASFLPRNATY